MHYFQLEIKEWVSNTAHLTLEEEAIYFRLIMYYYDSEKPIPENSLDAVFRKLRIEHKAVATAILNEFFHLDQNCDDGKYFWFHERCDAEISRYQAKHEQACKAGKASAKARLNGNPTAVEQPFNQSLIINQESLIINHKSIKTIYRPDNVFDDVWDDFVSLRKSKKATITATAMKGIEREARKAGLSISQALQMCCERNWVSFKAEWVLPKDNTMTSTQSQNLSAARSIFGDERVAHGSHKKIT